MNLANVIPSDNVIDCTPHIPTIYDAIVQNLHIMLIFVGVPLLTYSIIAVINKAIHLHLIRKRIRNGVPSYTKYETYTESLNPTKHSDYP